MSLLSLVQNACARVGVPRPVGVIASTSDTIIQMLSLANEEGVELSRRATWQILSKEKTFSAVNQEIQTGIVPDDFDRFIDGTFFNRTRRRPVRGPLTPQEWQAMKTWSTGSIVDSYRQRGNDIMIYPAPAAGHAMAFEYVSNLWCQKSDKSAQYSSWQADSDIGVLDENLMVLGVIWRFLRAKGLDYAEAFRTYEIQVTQAIARDGGKRILSFGERRPRLPGIGVPEGDWAL